MHAEDEITRGHDERLITSSTTKEILAEEKETSNSCRSWSLIHRGQEVLRRDAFDDTSVRDMEALTLEILVASHAQPSSIPGLIMRVCITRVKILWRRGIGGGVVARLCPDDFWSRHVFQRHAEGSESFG